VGAQPLSERVYDVPIRYRVVVLTVSKNDSYSWKSIDRYLGTIDSFSNKWSTPAVSRKEKMMTQTSAKQQAGEPSAIRPWLCLKSQVSRLDRVSTTCGSGWVRRRRARFADVL
jgi:hypothetical protein